MIPVRPHLRKSARRPWTLLGLLFLPLLAGCDRPIADTALVLTQVPTAAAPTTNSLTLDARYPLGSRVVLAVPNSPETSVQVLSQGLIAAGEPVVHRASKLVWFTGKATAQSPWQIYQTPLSGGRPKPLTSVPGGAMNPAISGNGDLIFSAPVPQSRAVTSASTVSVLYAQAPGGKPRRLTFGTTTAIEPAALIDGRILFISPRCTSAECPSQPELRLLTMNNDGTEVTNFALDHDGALVVRRPRELSGGIVAYLALGPDGAFRAETVRKARPFASRALAWPFPDVFWSSVEGSRNGLVLACLRVSAGSGKQPPSATAVYEFAPDATTPDQPLLTHPGWEDVEATPVAQATSPMGHISAIVPGKPTGTLLCLDVNFTRPSLTNSDQSTKAARVRVFVPGTQERSEVLGEVQPQTDGSFLLEVPADTPLGFETVDAEGRVLQHLSPAFWVRPGENRSCLGCHEPYNRSPRNVRPLAVTMPPVALTRVSLRASHELP